MLTDPAVLSYISTIAWGIETANTGLSIHGARPYYEQALVIDEKVLGAEHPDTALSLNNLGGLLKDMGDYEGARPYYERALAIFTARLGPDHPYTRTVGNNLAVLLEQINQASS